MRVLQRPAVAQGAVSRWRLSPVRESDARVAQAHGLRRNMANGGALMARARKAYKGRLTIGYPSGNMDARLAHIQLADKSSGVLVCEINIDRAEFM